MKVYVASSWRNRYHRDVVARLVSAGHDVYDFRNPPNRSGFAWSEIDPDWKEWSLEGFLTALRFHPLAKDGFNSDAEALKASDACVLVLPCGRSAHLEAGIAVGMDKPLLIYAPEPFEPELMYRWATGIHDDLERIVWFLREYQGAINADNC